MTAPKTCRACGTPLQGDVMWCLTCYEPVRQLTPREPTGTGIAFLPEATRERSRWKAGATTFGPVGRLVTTGIVLLCAPWSTNAVSVFVVWPAYLTVAVVVLRSVWANDVVQTTPLRPTEDESPPPPAPRTPLPRSTVVAWGVLVALGAAVAIAFASSGHVGRALILVSGCLAALVLLVRSFTRW